jgi:hypothetical protein
MVMQWSRCEPELDPRTRVATCFFRPAAGEPELRPGAAGRMELHGDAAPSWLRVPREAVTHLGERHAVFVAEDPQLPKSAEPVFVTVHGQSGSDWLIEAPELGPQSQVAVRGVLLLKSAALMRAPEGAEAAQ